MTSREEGGDVREDMGASLRDRATHEPSQSSLSRPSVSVPCVDEFSYMERSELLSRYRKAYRLANGRPADAVMYLDGYYEVRAGASRTRMRRKIFIEALLTLERRAGCSEVVE